MSPCSVPEHSEHFTPCLPTSVSWAHSKWSQSLGSYLCQQCVPSPRSIQVRQCLEQDCWWTSPSARGRDCMALASPLQYLAPPSLSKLKSSHKFLLQTFQAKLVLKHVDLHPSHWLATRTASNSGVISFSVGLTLSWNIHPTVDDLQHHILHSAHSYSVIDFPVFSSFYQFGFMFYWILPGSGYSVCFLLLQATPWFHTWVFRFYMNLIGLDYVVQPVMWSSSLSIFMRKFLSWTTKLYSCLVVGYSRISL